MSINWKVSDADRLAVGDIVKRAVADNLVERSESLDVEMSLIACHTNGNPLRLRELLNADRFNFAHDVLGISRHICTQTGKLTGFFSPRYSAPVTAAA